MIKDFAFSVKSDAEYKLAAYTWAFSIIGYIGFCRRKCSEKANSPGKTGKNQNHHHT